MGLRGACSSDAVISFSVMIAVEVAVAGGSIISKAALSRGMNRYVFVVYYNALGTLLLLPCFIFHRRRPPLTFSLMCKFFLLGMIGSYGMIFAYTERDSIWRLRHGIEYLSVAYSAIVGAILSVVVHTWYLRVKGPIFVSIFKPFGIVVAFIMSVIVLGEKLYIGSVIGSVVISIGFYGVLWGKFDEEKQVEDINTSSLEHVPLLAEAGDTENSLVVKG